MITMDREERLAWEEHQRKFPRFGGTGKQQAEFLSAFNAGRASAGRVNR